MKYVIFAFPVLLLTLSVCMVGVTTTTDSTFIAIVTSAIALIFFGVFCMFPLGHINLHILKKANGYASEFPAHLLPGELLPMGHINRMQNDFLNVSSLRRFLSMKRYYSVLNSFSQETCTEEPFSDYLVASTARIMSDNSLGERNIPTLFFEMDNVLNVKTEQSVSNSSQGYQLLTHIIRLYEDNGYTIYDYAELLHIVNNNFKECQRKHSEIESSRITFNSLEKYYEVLYDSIASSEDGSSRAFERMPIEWQWDMSVVTEDSFA